MRNRRTVLAGVAAAVLAAVVTSCHSSGGGTATTESATTPSVADAPVTETSTALPSGSTPEASGSGGSTTVPAVLPPLPTAEELNDRFRRAFAGELTPEEKTAWFEYGAQDPLLVDNLVEAAGTNHLTLNVTAVTPTEPGHAVATTDAISPTGTTSTAVPLVADDQGWKVSAEFTCTIVRSAGLHSPICPD